MNVLTTPRTDVATLMAFFRARAIDRLRRHADSTASLQRGFHQEHARRNRLSQADTTASFWILHAR